MSLFIIISYVAPVFIRTGEVADLIQGDAGNQEALWLFKELAAIWDCCFLGCAYAMAAIDDQFSRYWAALFPAPACNDRDLLLFYGFLADAAASSSASGNGYIGIISGCCRFQKALSGYVKMHACFSS